MLKKTREITPIILVLNNAIVWLVSRLNKLNADESLRLNIPKEEAQVFTSALRKLYKNCSSLKGITRVVLESLK